MPRIILLAVTMLLTVFTPIHFAVAGEGSVYDFSWLDKDKEVYVLQNRKFRKAGSPFITIGSGITTSGNFVDSYYFQGRAGFFFTEEWGFEGIYTKANGSENEAYESVQNINGTGSGVSAFRRIVDNYYGVAVLWSPFYGKINTFNSILYLDWIIGAGVGQLTESNNKTAVQTQLPHADETETHVGAFWETTLKFWVSQNWSVNFDIVGFHYQADKALNIKDENSKAYYSNYDLGLSLSYNF